MNSNIQIPKEFIPEIIESLEKKRDNLRQELSKINRLLVELEAQKVSDSQEQNLTENNTNNYNPYWKWREKVQFVLEHTDKELKLQEIIDELIKYEPGLAINRQKITTNVACVISSNGKIGYFKRRQNSLKQFLYSANKEFILEKQKASYFPDYKTNFKWKEKILFFLEKIDGLSSADIANYIIFHEPNLQNERLKLTRNVSSILNAQKRLNIVTKSKINGKFLYYINKNSEKFQL